MHHRCGIPANAIAIIKAFHAGFRARVMFQGQLGDRFSMSTRVRQGCCAAATLWNFYFWFVMRLWRDRCKTKLGDKHRGVIIKYKPYLAIRTWRKMIALNSATETRITDEQYVDDTGTLERTFEGLRRTTEILDKTVSDLGAK